MSIVFDILLGRPLMHSHGSSGIENGAITLIKMADMASASLIYRKTAGAGVPEVNTLATLKTDLVLVKADVGLGNVDNTTDAGKPVSTAQQTALDGKYTLQSANVVNESGADVDQRFEGDTDQNLLYLDASTDRVGIGIAIPTGKLHVQGASGSNILVIRTSSPSDALIIDQYGNVTTHQKLSVANPSGTTGLLNVNGGSSSNAGTAGFFMKGVGSQISPYINIVNSASAAIFNINSSGNVGIGTTTPSSILAFGGNSARVVSLERHTTADTAGNTLTITAGGATSGATDKAGGALILQGGLSTGSAESGVTIQGVVAGASGTTDRIQTTAIQVLGNKIGIFSTTPAVQQNTIIDADGTLADITTKFNTLLASLEAYGWLKAV